MTDSGDMAGAFERAVQALGFVPQACALGLEITRLERARVWGRAPFREDLVGDPEARIIAGGVVTTFLDQLCGAAVVAALDAPDMVATIDLRIDYMRPAAPGRDILAEALCYKLTRSVAFVRAVAYEDIPDDPVARVPTPHPPFRRHPGSGFGHSRVPAPRQRACGGRRELHRADKSARYRLRPLKYGRRRAYVESIGPAHIFTQMQRRRQPGKSLAPPRRRGTRRCRPSPTG